VGLAWGHAAVVLSIAAVVAFVVAVVGWAVMRSGRDPQPLPAEAHPDAAAAQFTSAAAAAAPQPSRLHVAPVRRVILALPSLDGRKGPGVEPLVV
jgi:hypothetical protein